MKIENMISQEVHYCLSVLIDELKQKEEYMDELLVVCYGDDELSETEAFEHWLVSRWLGKRLQEKGEMVIFDFLGLGAIWGRTTTGQAIYSDEVIEEIYKENY